MMSLYEHDRTHFNKMVASLLPVMNMLTAGDLSYLLSPDPEQKAKKEEQDDSEQPKQEDESLTNLAAIIEHQSVAYIGLDSLSDHMTGAAIGSMLLSDLACVAGNRYNYGVDVNTPRSLAIKCAIIFVIINQYLQISCPNVLENQDIWHIRVGIAVFGTNKDQTVH
jgi:hypothetical protein